MARGPIYRPAKRRGLLCNLRRRVPIRMIDQLSGDVITLTFDRQGRLNIDAPQRFQIEKPPPESPIGGKNA
jgi:hypothetical protein